jgi:hypothetical protein
MLRFTCVDLSSDEEILLLASVLDTNLGLIDMGSDMSLIRNLFNISPQSRHKFHITQITLFPFELEVAVYSNIEGIEKPG